MVSVARRIEDKLHSQGEWYQSIWFIWAFKDFLVDLVYIDGVADILAIFFLQRFA